MPTLTAAQTAQLKTLLRDRQATLLEEVRNELKHSDEVHYIDLAERVHDIGEASVANLLRDLDLVIIDKHIKEISAIEAALLAIGAGNYGTCADCSKEVGFERLLRYPTAKRCIACQAHHEKTYAQENRPSL